LAALLLYSLLILTPRIGDKMNTPMIYALIAFLFGGLMMFFWQLGMSKEPNLPSFVVINGLLFTLVGVVALFIQKQPWSLSPRATLLAVVAGVLSGISAFAAMHALKLGGEGSIVFPILSLQVMVAVMLAFLVFREPVTVTKLLGLGFGVTSIIFLSR